MTLAIQPVPETVASNGGTSDLCHEQCCIDPDTAMCDTVIAGEPWADDDEPTTCIVCHELIKEWARHVTATGHLAFEASEPCQVCPKRRMDGVQ